MPESLFFSCILSHVAKCDFVGQICQVIMCQAGAIGTTITKTIPIQSMKLVGVKEESIVKTCKPCGCISGGKFIDTNCCTQAHCNAPGQPLGSCVFMKLTCGCDESSCRWSKSRHDFSFFANDRHDVVMVDDNKLFQFSIKLSALLGDNRKHLIVLDMDFHFRSLISDFVASKSVHDICDFKSEIH
jgi:hypothetical protein